MRFFDALIVALVAGLATASCPYANGKRVARRDSAAARTIEGKKGIMYSRRSI